MVEMKMPTLSLVSMLLRIALTWIRRNLAQENCRLGYRWAVMQLGYLWKWHAHPLGLAQD